MADEINSSDVVTVVEAAKLLEVGKNALYDAIKRGEIPHMRVGKDIRLSRQAVMSLGFVWSAGREERCSTRSKT